MQATENELVITATQRLSLCWQQQGLKTGLVYSLSGWLKALWHQLSLSKQQALPMLLSPSTELAWWERRLSEFSSGMLSIHETAKQAMAAYALLKAWRIPLKILAHYLHHEEQIAFYHWAVEFEEMLAQKHFISEAALIDFLISIDLSLVLKSFSQDKKLLLVGFDEHTPQLKLLLEYLEQKQWTITKFSLSNTPKTVIKKRFNNSVQEILAMANFAKTKIKEGKTVGIISLSLQSQWSDYHYWFNQVFHSSKGLDYNLAYGLSLDQYAVVQTALTLIAAMVQGMDESSSAYLRHSPYITTIAISPIAQGLGSRVHWWDCFATMLNTWGWPGPKPLSTQDLQVRKKFDELIKEWFQVDCLDPTIDAEQALRELRDRCSEFVFEAPFSPSAIQVLGLLGSGGMQFDELWVSGLSQENWPPKPEPNPFLSTALQQYYQLPKGTQARQHAYARLLLDRLLNSAPHIVFSVSDPDRERPATFSAFLKGFPEEAPELLIEEFPTPFEQPPLVLMPHAVTPWKKERTLKGLTTLLTLQATCPFKAFAVTRLKLKMPEVGELGFNALEKGHIIHKALELFWGKVASLAELRQLSKLERKEYIKEVLHLACSSLETKKMSASLLGIEKERLERLLDLWLNLEQERNAFQCIAIEEKISIELLGHHFNLRIDRQDKDLDGTWVIDYKTARVSERYLLEDPSLTPQLPLYALASDCNTVVYAQIAEPAPSWCGISMYEQDLKGVKCLDTLKPEWSWGDLLSFWKRALEQTLEEYLRGINEARPKEGKKTCQQCHLRDLCRYDLNVCVSLISNNQV